MNNFSIVERRDRHIRAEKYKVRWFYPSVLKTDAEYMNITEM